jgi:hypothetical protein
VGAFHGAFPLWIKYAFRQSTAHEESLKFTQTALAGALWPGASFSVGIASSFFDACG